MNRRLKWILALAALTAATLAGIEIGGYADFLLRPAPGNPAAGKARVYVDSATNFLTCLLSTGASCIPVTTALPFPNYNHVGSVIITNFSNNTSTPITLWPGGSNQNACTTNTAWNLWPVAGYVRRATATTSSVQSDTLTYRAGLNPDCVFGFQGGVLGGAFVPTNAAAGSFVDASDVASHLSQGTLLGMAFSKQAQTGGPVTAAALTAIAAEFVADTGYVTVFPGAGGGSVSASSTGYRGVYDVTLNSTELNVAFPMPIAGTLQNFWFCWSGVSANPEVLTVRKTAVNTALVITLPTAVSATLGCAVDFTHTSSFIAGDYLDFADVTGSGGTATGAQIGAVITAAGTSTVVGGMISNTVSTTKNYSMPGAVYLGTTQVTRELGMPIQCTAANLYVTQATANGAGVTTTFTLDKNGSNTALTGTVTLASGTGSLLLDGTHTATFARGDLLQLEYVTNTGTSGTIGGWSISCN